MTNVDDTASMEDANMGEASQPLSTVGEGPSTAGDRSSSMKQQQSIGQDGYENAQEEEEEDDDDGEEEEERENNDDEHHPRHNHHDYDDEDKSMGAENQPPNGKRGHKSYKRKFAKQKIRFELAMGECSALFKEEARIRDLSKRLKQQNDQLLEVLAELNASVHVPPNQRFDLETDTHEPDAPRLEELYPSPNVAALPQQDYPEEVTAKLLDRAEFNMLEDRISPAEGHAIERSLLRMSTHAPRDSYAHLKNTVTHTTIRDAGLADIDAVNEEGTSEEEFRRLNSPFALEATLGFLTPQSESAYLAALDQGQSKILDGPSSNSDREREAAIRNPLSVYNWLRKHQPQALFPDGGGTGATTANASNPINAGKGKDAASTAAAGTVDTEKEKDTTASMGTAKSHAPSRTLASRASKSRASVQSAVLAAQTDDFIDGGEDLDMRDAHSTTGSGNGGGTGSGGNRSKRKRDDDAGYRPKGGNTSKTTKKRKEDAAKRAARRASSSATKTTAGEAESANMNESNKPADVIGEGGGAAGIEEAGENQ